MLAIVCPGQGAQKPGFLSPWRELPGVEQTVAPSSRRPASILCVMARSPTPTPSATSAVAQPLLVAAGIVAAAQLDVGRTSPAPM